VQKPDAVWEVPYLPIDPADVGRSYDEVVRVNSQSGKGGVSFLLQQEAGLQLPRRLQMEFSSVVQKVSDATGKEVKSTEIVKLFEQEYLSVYSPFAYGSSKVSELNGQVDIAIDAVYRNQPVCLQGNGNGPIDAAAHALGQHLHSTVSVVDYHEHAVGEGSDVMAVCYVELKVNQGKTVFGVGKDSNIVVAAIKALLNGVNRNLAGV
jgi:2-isopropylmalate synthase